jgi:hypothetical protein
MKKTKKRKRPTPIPREVTVKLAQCVLFALNNHKHMARGGGMMIDTKNKKTIGRWQDKFMDALDGVGYCIDRPAYYASFEKKGKKS